jgi:hypothetical protein
LKTLIIYLGAGNLYYYKTQDAVSLNIVYLVALTKIIVPLFEQNPILGIKQLDFLDWCKVVKLMNNGDHLTLKGFELIVAIKNGINNKR